MHGSRIFAWWWVIMMMGPWTPWAASQEKTGQVILDNLNNPMSVAIQPRTGIVFLSDSGNGRIIQIEDRKTVDVIVDFPVSPFDLDSTLKLGPLGIIFRGRDTLIVGSGGGKDGEDAIMMFNLNKMVTEPLTPEDADVALRLEAEEGIPAEGDFLSFDLTRRQMFVTCGGDKTKGWIALADLGDEGISNLRRQIPSSELARAATPGGMAISPEGHVVVAHMGSLDTPADSVLSFYSPAGELLDKFPTGLNDIVAITYGPRKKRLFALDFSWTDPAQGGLYQLVAVDSQDGCTAKLIARLARPTGMAFDGDGDVYVTVCGEPPAVAEELVGEDELLPDPGKLIRIRNVD